MNKNLKDRADALLQKIYQDGYTHGYDEGIKQLENYVSHPVGHWIDKEHRKEEYVLAGKCSVCGRVRFIDEFCSNCGARMESEEI